MIYEFSKELTAEIGHGKQINFFNLYKQNQVNYSNLTTDYNDFFYARKWFSTSENSILDSEVFNFYNINEGDEVITSKTKKYFNTNSFVSVLNSKLDFKGFDNALMQVYSDYFKINKISELVNFKNYNEFLDNFFKNKINLTNKNVLFNATNVSQDVMYFEHDVTIDKNFNPNFIYLKKFPSYHSKYDIIEIAINKQ